MEATKQHSSQNTAESITWRDLVLQTAKHSNNKDKMTIKLSTQHELQLNYDDHINKKLSARNYIVH